MGKVKLNNFHGNLQKKIKLTQLLVNYCDPNLGLRGAKEIADQLMGQKDVIVGIKDDKLEEFINQIMELGIKFEKGG